MEVKDSEKFNLFWMCNQTGKKHPAGVAFYNESQGDYRLKIDVMPEEKVIFLKSYSLCDNVVYYRIEAAVKRAGKVTHRTEIGTGHSSVDEVSPIVMDLGPFSRNLILERSL